MIETQKPSRGPMRSPEKWTNRKTVDVSLG